MCSVPQHPTGSPDPSPSKPSPFQKTLQFPGSHVLSVPRVELESLFPRLTDDRENVDDDYQDEDEDGDDGESKAIAVPFPISVGG